MFALFKYTNKTLWLLLALACQSLTSYAHEYKKDLHVHGFASQGYFLTDENNVFGNSTKDYGTFGLSRVGLNASFRPFDNLRFAIQGIYEHTGNVNDGSSIDFALLDWIFLNSDNAQMGVRLGRIKNPLGFYNEVRDIAFTRPSITLPGIYYERSHGLLISIDGAQLYANAFTTIGNLSFQLNIGELGNELDELETVIFAMRVPGHLDNKTSYLSKLAYESISGATHLAFSYAIANMEYSPGPGDVLHAGDLNFEQLILSAQHHFGDYTLTLEYMRQENLFEHFGPFYPKATPTTESYYLQADYYFNNRFKGYTRYDVLYLDKDDRNGRNVGPNFSRSIAFSKDYLLGLEWTPSNEWMLRVEYHRVNGTALLSFADNPDKFTTYWNELALQLSYRF